MRKIDKYDRIVFISIDYIRIFYVFFDNNIFFESLLFIIFFYY